MPIRAINGIVDPIRGYDQTHSPQEPLLLALQ